MKSNSQDDLNKYFGEIWEPSPLDGWEYSGLLDRSTEPHLFNTDLFVLLVKSLKIR